MLHIEKISVSVNDSLILRDFSMEIKKGEVHVIMGPNGMGKSTLAHTLSGHPNYKVLAGTIQLDGRDLLSMDIEERTHHGLSIGFQQPIDIPGLENEEFLYTMHQTLSKARQKTAESKKQFSTLLREYSQSIHLEEKFLSRSLNEGFSGGEKKKNELLQLLVSDPKLAVIDEIDSGLDVDALRSIAQNLHTHFVLHPERSLLLITHYQRILRYLSPDCVHILMEGKIVHSGDASLAEKVEEEGYEWLNQKQFMEK